MSKSSINRIGTLILTFVLFFSMSINANATENAISARWCVSSFTDTCNQPCETQLAQIPQVDTQRYYYNQLNEMERLIYQTFEVSKDKFINNETFSFVIKMFKSAEEKKPSLEEYSISARKAKAAFTYDNPEAVIWFQNVQLSLDRRSPLCHMLVCKPKLDKPNYSDFESIEEILPALDDFKKCAADFVSTLEGTDEQKLLKIYNWLIEGGEYDHDLTLANNTQNAYGAVINKKAVCSGFSFAFKYIADLAGLKVLYVVGWNVGKDPNADPVYHAWNMAYVRNQWYSIDVTGGVTYKDNAKKRSAFFMNFDYKSSYKFDENYFNQDIF